MCNRDAFNLQASTPEKRCREMPTSCMAIMAHDEPDRPGPQFGKLLHLCVTKVVLRCGDCLCMSFARLSAGPAGPCRVTAALGDPGGFQHPGAAQTQSAVLAATLMLLWLPPTSQQDLAQPCRDNAAMAGQQLDSARQGRSHCTLLKCDNLACICKSTFGTRGT